MANAKRKRVSAKELDGLYEQVLRCEPAIAPQDVDLLASLVMNQKRVGRNWRLTALLAGKGGAFYRELAEDAKKAEALAPATEILRDFAQLLRHVAELADSVSARIARRRAVRGRAERRSLRRKCAPPLARASRFS